MEVSSIVATFFCEVSDVVKLKDSETLNELKSKYDGVWNNILLYEEAEARKLINGISEQVELHKYIKHEAHEFKEYLKTPFPYIAVLVGIAIPVVAFLLLLLLP
ncbi:hypothetical protein D3C81_1891230 [compost metagenome]